MAKRRNVKAVASGYMVNGELIQTDWEFPRIAEGLGWSLERVQVRNGEPVAHARRAKGCAHRGTDGTIACPECGIPAGAFIHAAASYLDGLC